MDALEERVIAFVAHERNIRPETISLTDRINLDLGLDGDDAVEFFEKFGKEFSVNLKPLGHAWHEHFGSEGGLFWLGFVCFVLFAIGFAIHWIVNWIPVWAAGISLIVVWVWPLRCWPIRKTLTPVTVQDLVNAACTGSWSESRPSQPTVRAS
jgi:acyl carrier protein